MSSRKLRQYLLIALVMFSAMGIGACGNDHPANQDIPELTEPIAKLNISYEIGAFGETLQSLSFRLSYSAAGSPLTLFDLDLTEVESGDVVEFDSASSPGFDDFVSMLTNGRDDELYETVEVSAAGGVATHGGATAESVALKNRISNSSVPDLAGTIVSKIRIKFEKSSVSVPGSDPNGDGMWMDIWVLGEILFF